MTTIWTLNARDTTLYEVTMDYFGLTYEALGADTRKLHAKAVSMLAAKEVEYADLRNALVPHADRLEAALVFNSALTESGYYGWEIAKVVLPLIDKNWSGSILQGDLAHPDQYTAVRLLNESLSVNVLSPVHNTREFFAIYLTNLTKPGLDRLVSALATYPPFIGHIVTAYDSPTKDWLSLTLTNSYVKYKNTFIGKHEDDDEGVLDRNLGFWPIDENGYRMVSVPTSLYFDLFFSYKIERQVFPGFENDSALGLAAISSAPKSLDELAVHVEDAKVGYLHREKAGSLAGAGLSDITSQSLAKLILSKLASNYIYELTYRKEHNLSKFSMLLQVDPKDGSHPRKLQAVLAFEPNEERLRLITFY